MPERIRILIVIPTLDVGGAEMDLVRLLSHIDRNRFDCVVYVVLRRGPIEAELLRLGIEIVGPFGTDQPPNQSAHALQRLGKRLILGAEHRLRHIPIRGLLRFYKLSLPLKAYLNRENFDFIHAVLEYSYATSGISSLFNTQKLAMSRLSLSFYQQRYREFYFLERYVLHKRVDAFLANSKAVLQDILLEGISKTKARIVFSGTAAEDYTHPPHLRAQMRRQLELSDAALVFSAVANLWSYKGYADLITALAQADLPQGWVALIIGRDSEGLLPTLSRQVQDMGLSGNIRFLGSRSDVPALLAAADIHLSASHTEGMPLNILEAMSSGLPVVATLVGGIPELVTHGETGFLVPAHAPSDFANAVSQLAKDGALRAQFGENGRARAQSHFSLQAHVRAMEAFYEAVHAQPRRRHWWQRAEVAHEEIA